jgi:hypothetical protein
MKSSLTTQILRGPVYLGFSNHYLNCNNTLSYFLLTQSLIVVDSHRFLEVILVFAANIYTCSNYVNNSTDDIKLKSHYEGHGNIHSKLLNAENTENAEGNCALINFFPVFRVFRGLSINLH